MNKLYFVKAASVWSGLADKATHTLRVEASERTPGPVLSVFTDPEHGVEWGGATSNVCIAVTYQPTAKVGATAPPLATVYYTAADPLLGTPAVDGSYSATRVKPRASPAADAALNALCDVERVLDDAVADGLAPGSRTYDRALAAYVEAYDAARDAGVNLDTFKTPNNYATTVGEATV